MLTDNTLFASDQTENKVELVNDSYVETLVGEDKRYKSAEELAKAALEKETYISKLEKEAADYRTQLAKTETIEELLERQAKMLKPQEQPGSSNEVITPPEEVPVNAPAVSQEDISKLVAAELSKKEAEQSRARNLDNVKSKLTESFGVEAAQVWEKIKSESALSETLLQDLAATSPMSVLNLSKAVQATPMKTENNLFGTTVDPSKVSATGVVNTNVKSNSYYKELRKQQGGVLKPEQNRERLDAREILGDKFWD